MGLKVVKRDGKIEEYNSSKIYKAVEIASEKSGENYEIDIYSLTEKITNKIVDLKQPKITIEQIQSIVEHVLMVSKYKATAKTYITYRHDRNMALKDKVGEDVAVRFYYKNNDEYYTMFHQTMRVKDHKLSFEHEIPTANVRFTLKKENK